MDTFVAPARLFEHFHHWTPWVGPLLIALVVGAAIVLAVPRELLVEQARESILQAGDAAAQMPDAETLAGFGRIAALAGVLFGTPIFAFATAGVLALLFSVLGGGSASYRQYLAVATHAALITALGGLLTLPVQLLTGDLAARLSLALLLPFLEPGTVAHRWLQAVDVFTLWMVVVVALGVSVLNRRISWGTASAVLVGLLLAVTAAIAALSG